MSERSVIVKKGVVYIRRWVPEKKEYVVTEKEEQTLSDVLQFHIDIEKTTFGEFFELIAREAEFFERVFKASMYGHPIQPYIDEIEKPPVEDTSDIWKIRVYWGGEIFEGEITIFPGFDGYGKWNNPESAVNENWPNEGGIALEYTGLNEYKHIPFVLEKDFRIDELSPGVENPLIKGTMDFTVYDVINAILYEITWSGDISKGRKGPDLPPPSEIEDMIKRSDEQAKKDKKSDPPPPPGPEEPKKP